MTTRYCPIYEKDGHRLIVTTAAFCGASHEEATYIALGSMLVECILLGLTYTGEVLELIDGLQEHVPANVGGMPVALIGGPAFDAHRAAASDIPTTTTSESAA